MSDIELVIKISEDSYKVTCNGRMLPPNVENVVQGIKNGIPLKKGHGRLIDAGEYVDVLNNAQIEGLDTYKGLGRAKELLIETHTIIEADTE